MSASSCLLTELLSEKTKRWTNFNQAGHLSTKKMGHLSGHSSTRDRERDKERDRDKIDIKTDIKTEVEAENRELSSKRS